jgi:two-component system sensor histidine kinase PilS (NtrC family)
MRANSANRDMNSLAQTFPIPTLDSWRSLRYLTVARLALIGVLIVAISVFEGKIGVESGQSERQLALLLVYAAFSSAFCWLAYRVRSSFYAQILAAFFIDALFIALLISMTGGLRSGLSVLFFLPLSGTAVLLPTGPAYFCAAVTALTFLGESIYRDVVERGEPLWLAAGLHGVGAFAIVTLLRGLAARANVQEKRAREEATRARQAAMLSSKVIGVLGPAVTVVDASGVVRALNPAARALFADAGVLLEPGDWLASKAPIAVLADLLEKPIAAGQQEQEHDVELPKLAGATGYAGVERYKLRIVRVARAVTDESDTVLFLESARAVEERAQSAKLASMGRLTGSIAHEIRNPLAAIDQAAQLLNDDDADATTKRLTQIVRENTQRINGIVEDVLALSRSDRSQPTAVGLISFVHDLVAELPPLPKVIVHGSTTVGWFDPLHLRLTLTNLIRNAQRHCKTQVLVRIEDVSSDEVEVVVADDGEPIPSKIRSHLFEPFYTTHTQGTGLGLYLAREYCLANRAHLTYEERGESSQGVEKCFVVRMPVPSTI